MNVFIYNTPLHHWLIERRLDKTKKLLICTSMMFGDII